MLDLKEYAAIAGKPGLYKILKPTRTGVIIESVEEKPQRTTANATAKVSLLKEITIYTTDVVGSATLVSILETLYAKYPEGTPVNTKSDPADLLEFFGEILPDYDRERVYASDVKKIVNWYNLLLGYNPAMFEEVTAVDEAETAETPIAENAAIIAEEAKAVEATSEAVAEVTAIEEKVEAAPEETPKPKKAAKKAKAE